MIKRSLMFACEGPRSFHEDASTDVVPFPHPFILYGIGGSFQTGKFPSFLRFAKISSLISLIISFSLYFLP